ncbi:MAG TPA: flagellar biosynthesis repressor FlbT [Stellaceae bacterium]|nr:flagellar biosynthesis repressor FlbT [Stellaceae bacterium]
MPLYINLKSGERLIVNGVVIENFAMPAKLLIHNNAALLREKDILTEEDANTPARRIYFAIQCAYLFPAKEDVCLPVAHRLLGEFAGAAPSMMPIVHEIVERVDARDYYRALKSARHLIAIEHEILADALRLAGDEEPLFGTAPSAATYRDDRAA